MVHARDRMGRGRRSLLPRAAKRRATASTSPSSCAPPRRVGDDGARPRAPAAGRRDARHRLASLEHVPRPRSGAAALGRRRRPPGRACRARGRPRARRRAGCRCEARRCAATAPAGAASAAARRQRRARPRHRGLPRPACQRLLPATTTSSPWIDPAFGAARRYRLCGEPIRVLHAGAPTRLLRGSEGAVAARVGYGRGDITANALDGSFDNRALVRDDGALASRRCCSCAKATRSGSSTRRRARACCRCCGTAARRRSCSPARRSCSSSGAAAPASARSSPTRRGRGARSASRCPLYRGFIAAGGGTALHRASVRALEEEARRSIAGYASLLGARDRAEAIARTTREDAASLGAAMSPLQRSDRTVSPCAIARLERARRALLPDRRRSPHRPLLPTRAPHEHDPEHHAVQRRRRDPAATARRDRQGDGRPARRRRAARWSRSSPPATSSIEGVPGLGKTLLVRALARRSRCATRASSSRPT